MARSGARCAKWCGTPDSWPSSTRPGASRKYINPLRLLITAIILYAFLTRGGIHVSMFMGPVVLSLAPTAISESRSIPETIESIDRYGLLQGMLASRKESTELASEGTRAHFHQQLEKFAEPLSFANVLLLAVTLCLIFRRRRPLFVENAAFSMHFVSFVLLSSLLLLPLPRLLAAGWTLVSPLILAVMVWQFAYLTIAIRRFYLATGRNPRHPRLLASGAALVVYLLNSVFITAVQVIGGALALLRLPAH